jgi:DNA-binding Lrp family transcriptional regulator
MDHLDRSLLNTVQTSFPIAARPYQALAELAGTTEQHAWQRVQAIRQEGLIRRLGGVFDSHRLGYVSTLCAAKVPEEKIQPLADLLQGIPGITHNYLRNHTYNMWFTLIASSQGEVDKTLNLIKEFLGSSEVYSLPATALYKISVDFDFKQGKGQNQDEYQEQNQDGNQEEDCNFPGAWCDGKKPQPEPIEERDKAVIRALQGNLSGTLTPFADIAKELAWEEEEVLDRTQKLLAAGLIRRFGAVLRHQKAGFTANAMGVWQVPEEKTEEIGRVMAKFREVSHCYQRPTLPDWPYNLFTMIHGRSIEECKDVMQRISQATGVQDYDMLFSQRELKKSSMQYFMEEDD